MFWMSSTDWIRPIPRTAMLCWPLSSKRRRRSGVVGVDGLGDVADRQTVPGQRQRIDVDPHCLMTPPNGVMSVTPGTCSSRGSMIQSSISRSCRES